MPDLDLIRAGDRQRTIERLGHVHGAHRRAELPGNDVAREVIENRGEVVPTPVDDPEVREVGLPHLVYPPELAQRRPDREIGRLD